MKALRILAIFSVFPLAPVFAQGPLQQGSETVSKPKKDADEAKPEAKIPSKFDKKNVTPQGAPVFTANATTVTVDVAVLDNKNHFIPNIPKGNFRVLEDNVPQQVASYSTGEAPMTICMVIEFSDRFQQIYGPGWFQTLNTVYGFTQTLKPEDYVAVVAYDLKTEILSDFSTNRQETYDALQRLRVAGFSESSMYDALVDTEQRMQDIEGRKAILLVASGIDTMSHITFDKARKAIQNAGVPIYAIGLLQTAREMADAAGAMGSIQRLDFLQADNELGTFAKETGGMAFFPHFYGELPNIFQAISQAMRNQYVLTYTPSNQTRDGKFRKIKVELVNPETNQPLRVVDQKGKPIKYQIVAKSGYTAPRPVE